MIINNILAGKGAKLRFWFLEVVTRLRRSVSGGDSGRTESPLENGHTPGKCLLTAGYVIGSVVRDQRTVPGPDSRSGCDGRPGVQPASQDVRVEQLIQLVPNVRVHPSVDDRVGHGRRHGG